MSSTCSDKVATYYDNITDDEVEMVSLFVNDLCSQGWRLVWSSGSC